MITAGVWQSFAEQRSQLRQWAPRAQNPGVSGQILFTNIFNPALTKALHANLTLLTKQQTDRDTLVVDINARAPPFHALHRSYIRLALTGFYRHMLVSASRLASTFSMECTDKLCAHLHGISHVPRVRQLHTMRLLSACPRWQLPTHSFIRRAAGMCTAGMLADHSSGLPCT